MFESMSEPSASRPGPVVGSARFRHYTRQRLAAAPAAAVEPASAVLARLAAAGPSAAGLAELDAIDLDTLSRHDRVTALQLWEWHAAWLAGRQQAAIVAVGGAEPAGRLDGVWDSAADDWAREEIAAALRLSGNTAGSRLAVARELTGRLAATGAALTAGTIGYFHARALANATMPLDDAVTALVQATVLAGGAPDETLARFRRRVDRAVIAADPQTADAAHAEEVTQRRVVVDPQPHGMAWLNSYLTAPEALAAMAHINATAGTGPRPAPGVDDRPADVRRADALLALLTGAAGAGTGAADLASANDAAPAAGPTGAEASSTPPGRGPAGRPAIQVTADLPTLLHLAEHPGELAGYGPICPALTRALAADGDWRRLITDPLTGHLLDYGRTVYRPPEALARYVRARDRTCRFPGCHRRAEHCDLDHACPWEQLGLTCPANLGALCRRHHRLKTHAGWHLQSHPDGSATFTSPTGHIYQRNPIDHNPEHTARQRARAERDPEGAGGPADQDCDGSSDPEEQADGDPSADTGRDADVDPPF